jgi:hypothetical protein
LFYCHWASLSVIPNLFSLVNSVFLRTFFYRAKRILGLCYIIVKVCLNFLPSCSRKYSMFIVTFEPLDTFSNRRRKFFINILGFPSHGCWNWSLSFGLWLVARHLFFGMLADTVIYVIMHSYNHTKFSYDVQ